MTEPTRRAVLRTGWKVGGALLFGAAGYTAYEALSPLSTGAAGGKITVGAPSNFSNGSATYFTEGRFYVVNAGDHFFALSQKCPHLGCKIPFCDSSGRFECACHGSVFDLAGEYVKGPSPRGMDRYFMKLDGGNLVVDTGVSVTGPDRGTKTNFTPPKGPGCVGKA